MPDTDHQQPDSQEPPPSPPAPSGAMVDLIPGVRVPESALRMQFARSGGPGGQNVNKLNTKAELWVLVDAITGLSPAAAGRLRDMAGRRLTAAGELHLTAETERSQERNREAVMDRLRDLIRKAGFEPKPRRKTKPTRASKQRRLESKRRRGAIKSGRKHGGRGDE